MAEKGKLDHIEERLGAVEGGGSYALADMAKLCLVPLHHHHSEVQGV